eukprot:gb/GECG01006798.1/.p1 GENE.gb/GECG01006798.1/~~gb/GECG01006798.1/.p1  ORF type:complete len:374 (+),score=50.33 gb/GECG01006798.1/:1-1122(+)
MAAAATSSVCGVKKRKMNPDTVNTTAVAVDDAIAAMPSLEQVTILHRHDECVWHVSWHPTKAMLATCGSDKTVCVWKMDPDDESQWSCAAILDEATSRTIRSCEWSPDGKFLAAVSFDATVIIWEVAGNSFEPLATLEGHENEVKSVAWRPDGFMLATCSRDKSIWIWDADPEEFESISVLPSHNQDVKFVRWDPSGEYLVSASYDDTIKIWVEEEDEEWACVQTLNGHSSTVWGVAFDSSGKNMASCSDDCSVIIWTNQNKGKPGPPKWTQVKCLPGHHDRAILSIDWSKDGNTIASCGEDDRLCLYGPKGGDTDDPSSIEIEYCKENAHDGDINCVRWSPVLPHLLASAGDDCEVRIWRYHPDKFREALRQ